MDADSPDDAVVMLRPPRDGDSARLIAGRDDEWRIWLGPGSDEPRPTACIIVNGDVAGWVDYDTQRDWLEEGEVNIGYNVFPDHRGHGYAARAVELLLFQIGRTTTHRTATLLIDSDNVASLRVAAQLRCVDRGWVGQSRYFKLPIPRPASSRA